ncbi:esterase/lipase family protein [Nonomuraea guangzhouensis]|uniref:Esterase/lipase family protein n=1 Tax=Nonomuraea guangzhouensis TaxID=1291555 RepID=A0ABW4GFQ0_9ACTN|nr:hypothetical protein [Nonomuraea guangzhouensis]
MRTLEQLRHLVVIVPGLGGSVLETPDAGWRWDPGAIDLVSFLAASERLNLAETPELVPVGLVDKIAVGPWTLAGGYGELVRRIQRRFVSARVGVYRGDATPAGLDVLLFPYDFRRGVAHAALRLKDCVDGVLSSLTPGERRKRVIVIAHSMGGLVARYWLGPLKGADCCAALISLGVPHRGAPKAMDWLVNGVRVGSVALPVAGELLAEWPTTYDLLPRYPAILPRPRDPAAPEVMRDALYPHDLGDAVLGELRRDRVRKGYALHREIEDAWTSLGEQGTAPLIYVLFARGHRTPSRAVLDHGRLIVSKAPDPRWLPNGEWRGDGTVPALCTIPIELDDDRRTWLPVAERHRMMTRAAFVIDALRNLSAPSMRAVRGDERPAEPLLGLDLDDTLTTDDPVPVIAEIFGAEPGEETQAWVTVERLDREEEPTPSHLMRWEDGQWRAILSPLPRGVYQVRVEVVNIPVFDVLVCEDTLSVLAI